MMDAKAGNQNPISLELDSGHENIEDVGVLVSEKMSNKHDSGNILYSEQLSMNTQTTTIIDGQNKSHSSTVDHHEDNDGAPGSVREEGEISEEGDADDEEEYVEIDSIVNIDDDDDDSNHDGDGDDDKHSSEEPDVIILSEEKAPPPKEHSATSSVSQRVNKEDAVTKEDKVSSSAYRRPEKSAPLPRSYRQSYSRDDRKRSRRSPDRSVRRTYDSWSPRRSRSPPRRSNYSVRSRTTRASSVIRGLENSTKLGGLLAKQREAREQSNSQKSYDKHKERSPLRYARPPSYAPPHERQSVSQNLSLPTLQKRAQKRPQEPLQSRAESMQNQIRAKSPTADVDDPEYIDLLLEYKEIQQQLVAIGDAEKRESQSDSTALPAAPNDSAAEGEKSSEDDDDEDLHELELRLAALASAARHNRRALEQDRQAELDKDSSDQEDGYSGIESKRRCHDSDNIDPRLRGRSWSRESSRREEREKRMLETRRILAMDDHREQTKRFVELMGSSPHLREMVSPRSSSPELQGASPSRMSGTASPPVADNYQVEEMDLDSSDDAITTAGDPPQPDAPTQQSALPGAYMPQPQPGTYEEAWYRLVQEFGALYGFGTGMGLMPKSGANPFPNVRNPQLVHSIPGLGTGPSELCSDFSQVHQRFAAEETNSADQIHGDIKTEDSRADFQPPLPPEPPELPDLPSSSGPESASDTEKRHPIVKEERASTPEPMVLESKPSCLHEKETAPSSKDELSGGNEAEAEMEDQHENDQERSEDGMEVVSGGLVAAEEEVEEEDDEDLIREQLLLTLGQKRKEKQEEEQERPREEPEPWWWNEETKRVTDEKKRCYQKWWESGLEEDRLAFNAAKKYARKIIQEAQNQERIELAGPEEIAEESANGSQMLTIPSLMSLHVEPPHAVIEKSTVREKNAGRERKASRKPGFFVPPMHPSVIIPIGDDSSDEESGDKKQQGLLSSIDQLLKKARQDSEVRIKKRGTPTRNTDIVNNEKENEKQDLGKPDKTNDVPNREMVSMPKVDRPVMSEASQNKESIAQTSDKTEEPVDKKDPLSAGQIRTESDENKITNSRQAEIPHRKQAALTEAGPDMKNLKDMEDKVSTNRRILLEQTKLLGLLKRERAKKEQNLHEAGSKVRKLREQLAAAQRIIDYNKQELSRITKKKKVPTATLR